MNRSVSYEGELKQKSNRRTKSNKSTSLAVKEDLNKNQTKLKNKSSNTIKKSKLIETQTNSTPWIVGYKLDTKITVKHHNDFNLKP